jgi:hypothetical protein
MGGALRGPSVAPCQVHARSTPLTPPRGSLTPEAILDAADAVAARTTSSYSARSFKASE